MFTGIYQMAEKKIAVRSLYAQVHDYCRDYQTTGIPDFSVEICQADIDAEREKSAHEAKKEHQEIRNFPEEYLEELAVYRKIAEKMPAYDTILFHGSVLSVNGQGFLFTAKSGTGKSTHSRLWREVFGNAVIMINDDKPLIRITNQQVIAYGTPYNGKHRLGENTSVVLKGLCLLSRSEQNSIQKMTKTQAYPMLIQQAYRPENILMLRKTLTLIDEMAKNVTLYHLKCNMQPEAAKIAYAGMKGCFTDETE